MELPEDPMMLFSVINMKLRDCYASLDELCEDMNISKDILIGKLESIGFEYNAEQNRHRLKVCRNSHSSQLTRIYTNKYH